ncbi:MAG: DUF4157 domain-containing protein, partial [Bacteroidetes bacterium]
KCESCEQEDSIQRKESPEEEPLQREAVPEEEIQREAAPEEEEPIQQEADSHGVDVQPKLTIGAPGDPYEREADAMAERVMNMPDTKASDSASDTSAQSPSLQRSITPLAASITPLQRQESPEEEPEVQAQAETSVFQMSAASDPPADEEERNSIQRKGEGLPPLQNDFEQRLSSRSGSGNPLPETAQTSMEQGFGADFSNVRIHTDTEASAMSQQIHAQAFTHQNNIYFAPGKFDTSSTEGKRLLAHELTHTVQQGASAVQRKPASLTPAPPMIQGLGVVDLIPDWIINDARNIPGYTLLTVIIEYDPLLDRDVPRTPVNLIEGLMGLVPFGTAIFDKLQEYGIIQRVFDWVEGKLSELHLTTQDILNLLSDAWDETSAPFTDAIEIITRKFSGLFGSVRAFASSLIDQIIEWVKEALIDVAEPLLEENRAWSLIKKIIRFDPLRGEAVQATTVEILEDFLLLIGKQTELERMRAEGTLQQTADWLDTQVGTFMSLLAELRGVITALWDAIQPSNIGHIRESLTALAAQITGFLRRVWDFALTVAAQVLQFIKDVLLALLREHAGSIRGYRLFTVILGKDPVTDQVVERNARNIIAGFMELVAGPEQYQQMEESGAIDRMAAWVDGLIQRYGISLTMIRDLFLGMWNAFTIDDLVHPLDAIERVLQQFRDPITRLLGFVREVIQKLIEVVLELMNFPTELISQIIARAAAAFEDIQRDPVGFLMNLLRAVKQGFSQFFDNIGGHLVNGLVGWLTSELAEAGIQPPRDFSFQGVLTFVLDVLGISMERIWQKLAEHPQIGPERVARVRQFLETAGEAASGVWSFIQDVQREGIGAIWRHIQEQLSNLWDTVLGAIQNWIT